MKSGLFKTPNIYIASIIGAKLKIEPTYEKSNGMIEFVFPANDVLYQCLNDFNSGGFVEAYAYAESIKKLRAEMYKRKKTEDRGESNNGYNTK
ncbi:MAG: hypothetical protein NTU69_08160 [Proteobacteria bacterium]|nr:hypothetical protein [Pseudomonadota bacterium]